MAEHDQSKTMLKRIDQHRDRWTSYGAHSGLTWISEKLTPDQLRESELLRDLDDAFLERISPDVSMALWDPGVVLFEEGSYIDVAFFVEEGEVDVSVDRATGPGAAVPIFDRRRSGTFEAISEAEVEGEIVDDGASLTHTMVFDVGDLQKRLAQASAKEGIAFLSTMDFDLPAGATVRLGPGEIFGEIGALSGWPQSVSVKTATPCRFLQIRVPALRLLKRKSKAIKQRVDAAYRERTLLTQLQRTPVLSSCDAATLTALKEQVELVSCEPDEVIVRQGEPADALYLVRSGFVKVKQRVGADDMVLTYLAKGMTLGEVELLIDGIDRWEFTAQSLEHAELVKIPRAALASVVARAPTVETSLWRIATDRIRETGNARIDVSRSELTQAALDSGLVQGSSMLVIDVTACTRCDDCVRACAATHDGRQRFVREGNRLGSLMIARSCYHCQDPVCLVGCPTGAIHRAGVGQVVEVSEEICIGCGTCSRGCPYDAIVMHETGETWPDDMVPENLRGEPRRVASKCDLCHDRGHDPACVTNCPQGCAYRVGSVDELRDLLGELG